jgi:aspartate 1-decarboxylase
LHCEAAGIYPLEFVDIWNKSSGARLSTYVIFGEAGSGCCILNGAAARTCQAGDEIIIAAAKYINNPSELHSIKPVVLTFKEGNRIDEILQYDVFESTTREYDFKIEKLR